MTQPTTGGRYVRDKKTGALTREGSIAPGEGPKETTPDDAVSDPETPKKGAK